MRSGIFKLAIAVGLGTAVLQSAHAGQPLAAAATPDTDKAIIHVLNRIGYGPRPGDVEKVRAIGVQAYIDQQLRPERIPDSEIAARLSGFDTLRMSSRQIAEQYEQPLLQARRQRKQAAQETPANQANPAPPEPTQVRANRPIVELGEQKVLRAVYSDRQLEAVLTDFWFNHFNVDARKGRDRFMLTEYERDVIRPHVLGKFRDLLGATAKSPAMLFYLDNWMSADPNGPHPNARQAMRPRTGIFGRGFGGGGAMPGMPARPGNANARRGLNENYGRELMELHTLGVDGGYTQKDVTEVARAFTGWTIRAPMMGGDFVFEPRFHDPGQKVVLGHVIQAGGGERDGEDVLDILARSPSTAHVIATKLVRRFVSDTPPPALVDRAAARFRATDGDLREVMRTILTSPEFLSPEAYRAKVKTPFEFVVSAMRAVGADVQDAAPVVRTLQQLGMPLYMCQPPTGYKDTADAWVNTGALVSRMNFALQLTSGRMPNTNVVLPAQTTSGSTPSGADDTLIRIALANDVSETTRATIGKATTAEQVAALTLGSPEFQRR